MAENKLSWTELRRALATRAGISEKEANTFLSAFNAQLVDGLKQDKQVRINGLGMFRLQAVAPRKSVNVTTGEEITIDGYNKIAFVPEAGVKELVEKGTVPAAAVSQSAEPIDPIQKLGAQAEEIVDILGELGQKPNEAPVAKEEPVVEEPKVEEPPVIEEPVVEAPQQVEEPVAEEPIQEEAPVAEVPVIEEPVAEEPKKEYHFMRDTLICVVILLMLLLIGYFFLRNKVSNWIESLTSPQETEYVEDIIEEIPETEAVAYAEEETYDDLLLTENITNGSRLAWIAKKHYGNKDLWPYLYAANKDILDDPSKIVIGTPIRVPKLSAAQRDTNSVRFQQLKEEAYGKIKR